MKSLSIAIFLSVLMFGAIIAVFYHNEHFVKKQIHSAKKAECVNGIVILDGTHKAVDIMNAPLKCRTNGTVHAKN